MSICMYIIKIKQGLLISNIDIVDTVMLTSIYITKLIHLIFAWGYIWTIRVYEFVFNMLVDLGDDSVKNGCEILHQDAETLWKNGMCYHLSTGARFLPSTLCLHLYGMFQYHLWDVF